MSGLPGGLLAELPGGLLAALAGLLAGGAVLCGGLRAGHPAQQRLAALLVPAEPAHTVAGARPGLAFVRWSACVGVVSVALSLVVTRAALPVVPLLAVLVWRWRAARSGAAKLRATRAFVLELCPAFAAELRGGHSPIRALGAAVAGMGDGGAGSSEAAQVAAAIKSLTAGSDPAAIPSGLAAVARRPGANGLAGVAVCWGVAGGTGAGLAASVDRLGESLRAEAAVRREIEAQLSAPRATARLLAGLPLLGLVAGTALGADPLSILLGPTWGRGCLVLGSAMAVLGMWWVDRIATVADVSRRAQ